MISKKWNPISSLCFLALGALCGILLPTKNSSPNQPSILQTNLTDKPATAARSLQQNTEPSLTKIRKNKKAFSAHKLLEQNNIKDNDFEAMFHAWESIRLLSSSEIENLINSSDLTNKQNSLQMQMLVARWATVNGAAAIHFSLSQSNPVTRSSVFNNAMKLWMKHSPEQAYHWLMNNQAAIPQGPFGGNHEEWIVSYFIKQGETDVDSTINKLQSLDPSLQEKATKRLAQTLATNAQERNQLLAALSNNPDLLLEAQEGILEELASQNPQEALTLLKEYQNNSSSKIEHQKLTTMAHAHLEAIDPETALELQAEQLSGTANAGDQIADAFGSFVAQDEDLAADWLRKQDEAFLTDNLFKKAGEGLIWSGQIDRAAEWYDQIHDPALRQQAFNELESRK